MELIEATTQLKGTHFKKFRKLAGSDDELVIATFEHLDITLQATISTFRSFFQEQKIDCADDEIVTFATENVALVCSGLYYKKWCKPSWSICIFADETKTKSTDTVKLPTKTQHVVSIAYEDALEDAETKTGSNSELTKWINQYATILTLRAFFKRKVVIKIDDYDWLTIDELKEKGVLK